MASKTVQGKGTISAGVRVACFSTCKSEEWVANLHCLASAAPHNTENFMSTLGGEGVVDREAWLKNSFEFAYVTQFLNFFYPAFGLDSFSYHDLEALLLDEPDHVTRETTNFFKRILKALPNVRLYSTPNWLDSLIKEYRKRHLEAPLDLDQQGDQDGQAQHNGPDGAAGSELDYGEPSHGRPADFASIVLETRVRILYDLCGFHLEHAAHFMEHLLKGYDEGASWRLESIGKDMKGMVYWLFEDGRLFREKVTVTRAGVTKTDPSTWQLVAYDRASWDSFLAKGLTKKPGDRRLREALETKRASVEEALEIQEAYAKKKSKELAAAAMKVHFDNLPRKRSARLQHKEETRLQKVAEEEEERKRQDALYPPTLLGLSPISGQTKALRFDHNLSREERAELRRQRLEREANEKLLRELEAEKRAQQGSEEDVSVDVEQDGTDRVLYQVEVEPKSPLKLFIRRSSIPGGISPAAQKRPPKKAMPDDVPFEKVGDFKAMIIKRILKTVADTRAKRQPHADATPCQPSVRPQIVDDSGRHSNVDPTLPPTLSSSESLSLAPATSLPNTPQADTDFNMAHLLLPFRTSDEGPANSARREKTKHDAVTESATMIPPRLEPEVRGGGSTAVKSALPPTPVPLLCPVEPAPGEAIETAPPIRPAQHDDNRGVPLSAYLVTHSHNHIEDAALNQ